MSLKNKEGLIISTSSYIHLKLDDREGYSVTNEQPTHKVNEDGEISEIEEPASESIEDSEDTEIQTETE